MKLLLTSVGINNASIRAALEGLLDKPLPSAAAVFVPTAGPPQAGSDRALGLTPFVMRPHLNSADFPNITVDRLARQAGEIAVPMYAIDDQTAIKVVDGQVQIVSEGEWKLFDQGAAVSTTGRP